MKRNGKYVLLGVVTVFFCLQAAGCASSSKSMNSASAATAGDYATDNIYDYGTAENAVMPEQEAEMTEAGQQDSGSIQVFEETDRKLIKNVDLQVETEEYDTLITNIKEKIKNLGGYIEVFNAHNASNYYDRGQRNADLTIRIPADKLDQFLEIVSEESNVIERSETVSDITLTYVDMESHKKALQAEQESLLVLLEKAETVENIIALQGRLTEVRYQLESMESQLRAYDNQVTYGTIHLYIAEVKTLTPVKEQTALQKISTGFTDSIYHIGNGFKNCFIEFIIILPYLAVWAAAIVLMIVLVRFVIRMKGRRGTKFKKTQADQDGENKIITEQKKEPK